MKNGVKMTNQPILIFLCFSDRASQYRLFLN